MSGNSDNAIRAQEIALGINPYGPDTGPIRDSETPKDVKELFHKAWGQAHDSPDYEKETWRQLRQALYEEGVEL